MWRGEESKVEKYAYRAQVVWMIVILLCWSLFAEQVDYCYEWLEENDFSLSIIAWLLVLVYLFIVLFAKRRKKKVIRDVVFYDPPKGFTAAEVAVIDSWWPTWRVFPAMLYDWVARKNVKMTRMPSWEICFEKLTDNPFFLSDEKYLYSYHSAYNRDPEDDFWNLCFVNRTHVTIRMLMKIPWIDKIPNDFFYQVQRQCLDWNAYKKGAINPSTISWEKSIFIFVFISCLIAWFLLSLNLFIVLSIAALIRVVSLYYKSKESVKEYYLTDYGVQVVEQIQWFKKYLLAVEDSKLKVILKEDPTYFERILPYAIAMWIWDGWLNKVFKYLQYDELWWTIFDYQTSHFRTNPEDLAKLHDWIANSIAFISLYNETRKNWWSLFDALTKHNLNKEKPTFSNLFLSFATNYSNSRYSCANWYGWHAKK